MFIASMIFQLIDGLGFIPAFIIAYGLYWSFKKIIQALLKKEKFEKSISEKVNDSKKKDVLEGEKNIKLIKFQQVLIWLCIFFVIIFIISIFYNSTNKQIAEVVGDNKNNEYSEESKTYINKKYNFKISFPEGWMVKEGNNQNILQKAIGGNDVISVGAQEIPREYSYQTITIKDITDIREIMGITDFAAMVLDDIPDAKIIVYGESILDNKPAYYIKYSIPYTIFDRITDGVVLQYQTLHNNILYLIIAESVTFSEFQLAEPKFIKSISTFVINDN